MSGCVRFITDIDGFWKAGKSKLRTVNAKLDQEDPPRTSCVYLSVAASVMQAAASVMQATH
jgi:hypothetical protein